MVIKLIKPASAHGDRKIKTKVITVGMFLNSFVCDEKVFVLFYFDVSYSGRINVVDGVT